MHAFFNWSFDIISSFGYILSLHMKQAMQSPNFNCQIGFHSYFYCHIFIVILIEYYVLYCPTKWGGGIISTHLLLMGVKCETKEIAHNINKQLLDIRLLTSCL